MNMKSKNLRILLIYILIITKKIITKKKLNNYMKNL